MNEIHENRETVSPDIHFMHERRKKSDIEHGQDGNTGKIFIAKLGKIIFQTINARILGSGCLRNSGIEWGGNPTFG